MLRKSAQRLDTGQRKGDYITEVVGFQSCYGISPSPNHKACINSPATCANGICDDHRTDCFILGHEIDAGTTTLTSLNNP